MQHTHFATKMAAVIFLLSCFSAHAGNNPFLPQSLSDTSAIRQSSLPAPAPQVKVNIPAERIATPIVKEPSALRLSTGQSKNITLDEDAASVIVANPAHATVFLDSARNLIIVPRAVGATNFKILNRQGQVILNQAIVVNDTDDNAYVRVTRICGNTPNCQASTTYFCPDNCVPVSVPQAENNVAYPTIPPIAALPPLPELPNDQANASPSPPLPMPPTAAEGVN